MKTKSFTLIELLVVIVIIGILAGVIIVSTSSSISKASIAKVKVFENSVQNELGANMVSRWKLDEISGGVTPDAWGNNPGTIYGDPTVKDDVDCVSGKCMEFDGVDDYIDCGNNNSLNIKDNLTLSAWFFVKDFIDYSGIISTGSGAIGQSFSLHIRTEDKITFSRSDGVFWTVNSFFLLPNKWYHVAGVDDGNKILIYIDGYKNSYTNFLGDGISMNYFHIGNYSSFFKGLLDDVRIYNAALTTSQIKQEYIAGLNSLLANNNISKEEYDERINSLALNND